MVPFVTLLIPLYLVMLDLRLLNSYAALWLPAGGLVVRHLPLPPVHPRHSRRTSTTRPSSTAPSDFAIYHQIILPLIRPVLSALAIFSFLGSFNSYLWPLVVLNDEKLYTLPLILVQISTTMGGTNYQAVMAGSLLACIPTIVVYLLFQRNFVRGHRALGRQGIETSVRDRQGVTKRDRSDSG